MSSLAKVNISFKSYDLLTRICCFQYRRTLIKDDCSRWPGDVSYCIVLRIERILELVRANCLCLYNKLRVTYLLFVFFLRQNVLVQSECCKHANEMSVLAVRGAVWQPSFLRCVLALRCVFSYFAKAERSVHTTRVDGPCSRLVWTGAREHGP